MRARRSSRRRECVSMGWVMVVGTFGAPSLETLPLSGMRWPGLEASGQASDPGAAEVAEPADHRTGLLADQAGEHHDAVRRAEQRRAGAEHQPLAADVAQHAEVVRGDDLVAFDAVG